MLLTKIPGVKERKSTQADVEREVATKTQVPATRLGRFVGAAILSFMGVLFSLAGLIEGQGLAFVWAVVSLGGAYWLYTKR